MKPSKILDELPVVLELIKYFWRTQKPFILAGAVSVSYFASIFLLLKFYHFSDLTPNTDLFVIVYCFPSLILLGSTVMLGGIGGLIGFITESVLLWVVIYKLLLLVKKRVGNLSGHSKLKIAGVGGVLYVVWIIAIATLILTS